MVNWNSCKEQLLHASLPSAMASLEHCSYWPMGTLWRSVPLLPCTGGLLKFGRLLTRRIPGPFRSLS
eukprot:10326958-Heterocapsa_arctica.AAC.1